MGVIFFQGGKGRLEDCKIWGNILCGVLVRDQSSEAVVVGCKCAGAGKRQGRFFGGTCILITQAPNRLIIPPATYQHRLAGFTMEKRTEWLF